MVLFYGCGTNIHPLVEGTYLSYFLKTACLTKLLQIGPMSRCPWHKSPNL